MKIKHIYITKEGEPMANPEMEYPTFNAWRDSEEVEEQAKAKYHSGLLPFEDREEALKKCYTKDEDYDDPVFPGEIVPVDLEVEVVDQTREIGEEKWNDGNYDNTIFKYHRKVLRIKP